MIHMPVPISETLKYTRSVLPSTDNVDILVISQTNEGVQRRQIVCLDKVSALFRKKKFSIYEFRSWLLFAG
jgi:hypothetical protein